MKILSADEIRRWDQYTIEHEPISSIELMERAATTCVDWLLEHHPGHAFFSVFCGKGNNGGDGLAIARLLMQKKFQVRVYILEFGHKGTADFQANLARLHLIPENDIHFIQSEEHFHPFGKGEIIIDALFGSGLNRELDGVTAALVNHINTSGCPVISIDIPSGLSVDKSSKGHVCIKATHTLGFQCYKPAFLFAENEKSIGQLHILDIGLHPVYYENLDASYELTDELIIHSLYRPRKPFSHKGNFGHALLLAGSEGKIGAAVLAAKACLRSGVGLLTCHIPSSGINIIQTAVPEAMVSADIHASFITKMEEKFSTFDVMGIGPGIGTSAETILLLKYVFQNSGYPLVIDADAINGMAVEKELLMLMPAGSILTPHPKEFDRLFGESPNEAERISLAIKKAKELNCVIVLKGHHTCIATGGTTYFNSTGNAGMATAGSGDVLTGILTGLLAQGYSSIETAILGVYIHGLAGDIAANHLSMEGMIAGDITASLGKAFLQIQKKE